MGFRPSIGIGEKWQAAPNSSIKSINKLGRSNTEFPEILIFNHAGLTDNPRDYSLGIQFKASAAGA